MKVQLTKQERMGEFGHSLLRLLQNESLPLIDLFIREAIQNSLDATLPDAQETLIDVGVKNFNNRELATQLEGISDVLNKRYADSSSKAIYISDKNTTGLTGAIRDDDNQNIHESKIYKLIYGISMNQTQSGAGGSWGLGKTSFFRLGNGIVIYYTRVKTSDGNYEERMAASLIEDSNKKDALLKENSRGIAWWGTKEGDSDNYADTYPITDSDQIKEMLEIFNINPYIQNETGTTVIIPYIDENRIESHDLKHEDNEFTVKNWWEQSLESRIEVAIQKWYGIRAFNKYYQKYYGSYLNISVNENKLEPEEFPTVFQKLRELYSYALRAKDEPNLGQKHDNFKIKNIQLNRMALSRETNKIVGDFAFCTLDKKDLSMTPPDNEPHPLEFLGYTQKEDVKELNSNIIAYTRKPAMIIEYDVNGIWSQNVPRMDDRIILGIFVPRSEQKLHEDFQEEIEILDDYLRKSENADHASWQDVVVNDKQASIVSRIKGNVSKSLNEEFNNQVDESKNSKASMLGRKLGNLVLPENDFGRKGKPPVRPMTPSGEGPSRIRKLSFDLLGSKKIAEDTLEIDASITFNEKISCVVDININMGTRVYPYEKWESDMEIDFPFEITKVYVESIGENKINKYTNEVNLGDIEFIHSAFSNPNRLEIRNNHEEKQIIILLSLTIKIKDKSINPIVQVKEVKSDD